MPPYLAPHPPVVDLSEFEDRREHISRQLMAAATDIGFFYVKGHGVPQSVLDAAFTADQRLQALPVSTKESFPKVNWDKGKLFHGYQKTGDSEPGAPAWESFVHLYDIHPQMKAAWPGIPGYRQAVLEFMESMHLVAAKVLSCFARGLGLPDNFFEAATDVTQLDNHSVSQFNFYTSPTSQKWDHNQLRIFAHTDEALITLLQTAPGSVGLEVAAGKDGRAVGGDQSGLYKVADWMPCPHLPGHIVVNVGDALQLWSDGILKSNFHRVRSPRPGEPQGERLSLAYFVWPNLHHRMEGKSGKGTTMAEFMAQKGKLYGSAMNGDINKPEHNADAACAVGLPQHLQATSITAQ